MHLTRLIIRGFRNLGDREFEPPAGGMVLLGPNAQGKTNLLEAIYYPVLFRSLRGAADQELVRFGDAGFRVEIWFRDGGRERQAAAVFTLAGRKKRLELDSAEVPRLADAAGEWLAVAFLPSEVALGSGPTAVRRHYLDRTLALADRGYLRSLGRYRAALAQRNAALRQGRPDLARAFEGALAAAGARILAARLDWVREFAGEFAALMAALGAEDQASLAYTGREELKDPEAWPTHLERAAAADRARGATTVGPHRDDLSLQLGSRALRDFGSTGQQRTAAIALKLLELATLRRSRGIEPALLLDDVFAELDGERQRRLADLLLRDHHGQVFLTAPRLDELPKNLGLPVWGVARGRIDESHA